MTILGDLPVGEPIPENTTRKVIILTSWRSGSSFLGDLLNHYPGTFYYFEPLHYYSYIKDKSKVQTETDFFKSLLSCKFDEKNQGFLEHVRQPSHSFLFNRHNFRLWNSCKQFKPREALCYSQDYLNQICPLYPIKLVKTVRSRVASLEELIKNSTLNLKVLVLVRDPRGTHNSRVSGPVSTWCSSPSCSDPQVWCPHLLADITAAFKLERSYPGTVLLVRYEDLSMDPITTTTNILTFLQLPLTRDIQLFIETHSYAQNTPVWNRSHKKKDSKKDPYGTIRDSSATASAWKKSLDLQDIFQIQQVCREPMEILGYTFIKEETDLKSQKYPLEKTAEEVWFGNVNS